MSMGSRHQARRGDVGERKVARGIVRAGHIPQRAVVVIELDHELRIGLAVKSAEIGLGWQDVLAVALRKQGVAVSHIGGERSERRVKV